MSAKSTAFGILIGLVSLAVSSSAVSRQPRTSSSRRAKPPWKKAGKKPGIRKAGQTKPVVELRSEKPFSTAEVIGFARQIARRANLQGDEILVRAIDPERRAVVLTTGTDRDAHSSEWVSENGGFFLGNDAAPEVRKQHGIEAHGLTYAARLRWKQNPPVVTWGGSNYPQMEVALSEWLSPAADDDTRVRGILFYHPSRLRKAPGAEVEYWFNSGDAKEALLGAAFTK